MNVIERIFLRRAGASTDGLDWYETSGGVCVAADAMFCYVELGVSDPELVEHFPRDFYDFACCLSLIEAVPKVGQDYCMMGELSPGWSETIMRWQELESLVNTSRYAKLTSELEKIAEKWAPLEPALAG